MKIQKLLFAITMITSVTLFIACSDDEGSDTQQKGQVIVEITDAPVDDANVEAVMVTVTDVKLNGKSVEGFNATTIDIKAYQNGRTKILTDSEVELKSYDELTLVLDGQKDANGNAPGCYVLMADGSKQSLIDSKTEIKLDHDYMVDENQNTRLVVDFDLRKAIKRNESGNSKFSLVSSNDLKTSLRIVDKEESSTIKGNCNSLLLQNSDKVLVYAYLKGSYNRSSEVNTQNSGDLEFKNAVTSAALGANGDFELHFLKEGDYEIHFAAYEQEPTGEMKLQGTLIVEVLTSLDIAAINLSSSSTVNLNVLATGLLPI